MRLLTQISRLIVILLIFECLTECLGHKIQDDEDTVTVGNNNKEKSDQQGDQNLQSQQTGSTNATLATNTTQLLRKDDPCRACSKLHRGILHRVVDPEDFSKGCLVYGVLYCNTFELYRGQLQVNSFDVNAVTTPILLTPGSHYCFTIKQPGRDPEILCAENLNCRNEWWKALTRGILCEHHGTELRREIAGEPIIEEEQEMVAEKVVDKPEKGGINIKFSGISEMPVVKLRTKKVSLFGGD